MDKKLTKAEFMQLVVNDLYKKKARERERLNGADTHAIQNINKVKEFRRKKLCK
jgi:DNA topoisomerase VI subunit A